VQERRLADLRGVQEPGRLRLVCRESREESAERLDALAFPFAFAFAFAFAVAFPFALAYAFAFALAYAFAFAFPFAVAERNALRPPSRSGNPRTA
jgi:hypothetical protein